MEFEAEAEVEFEVKFWFWGLRLGLEELPVIELDEFIMVGGTVPLLLLLQTGLGQIFPEELQMAFTAASSTNGYSLSPGPTRMTA